MRLISRFVLGAATLLAALQFAAPAAAQAARDAQPARYLASVSVGAPLRLARNVDFDQDAVAPFFTDFFGGYVFEGDIRLRHGLGFGASLNLGEEGGFTEPVGVGEQLVLMPAYLLFYDMNPDWAGLAHAGIPINVAGGTSAGLEFAGALAYRFRAGLGVFGELGFDIFPGAEKTAHASVSLELGIILDYEVLP